MCCFFQAVCCADKEHCCPQDYQCDSATGECIHHDNGAVRIPWAQKLHAKPRMENKEDLLSVLCPDGKGTCPEGSTCCLLSSGQYGCCPLPKVAGGFILFTYGVNMTGIKRSISRENVIIVKELGRKSLLFMNGSKGSFSCRRTIDSPPKWHTFI